MEFENKFVKKKFGPANSKKKSREKIIKNSSPANSKKKVGKKL